MPVDRTSPAARPPSTRSAVSNGSAMLAGVDGRSALARRFRDLCERLAADLGGEASLTEAERLTVRSAAAMAVHAEELQARIVRGELVDADEAVRVSNASARLLASLRTKHTAKAPPQLSLRERLQAEAAL